MDYWRAVFGDLLNAGEPQATVAVKTVVETQGDSMSEQLTLFGKPMEFRHGYYRADFVGLSVSIARDHRDNTWSFEVGASFEFVPGSDIACGFDSGTKEEARDACEKWIRDFSQQLTNAIAAA